MKKAINFANRRIEKYGNLFDIPERKELIGETLRVLREASGLTQAEIAKHIGIKPVTYSTYENGTREAPAEIIVRLSILYDVPTDIILQKQECLKATLLFKSNRRNERRIKRI